MWLNIYTLETIYLTLILVPTLFVFLRVFNLYSFSKHKGLLYFSGAFLLFACSFMIRYLIIITTSGPNNIEPLPGISPWVIILELALLFPGILFIFSLSWKKMPKLTFLAVFVGALVVSIADYLMGTLILMYISQIIIFIIASFLAYRNLKRDKKPMQQVFLACMLLFILVWIINLVGQLFIPVLPVLRIVVYILTIIIAYTLLIMVNKIT